MKLFSNFCDIKKCLNLQGKSRTLKKQKSKDRFHRFDCNVVSVFVGTENFFSHDIKNTLRENKETVKLINEALIRAMCYFESHREDCVDLMVDQLNANKEYVEAYMLNEHYRINQDTVKNIVMDNYNYMMKVGGIENPDKSVNMEDRIYNKLYKEALDEAVEKWGDEDKDFYDNAVKFYQENNE